MGENSIQKEAKDLITVGELSKRTGVNISALHFYEEKGIIKSTRNNRNQRQYERSVIRTISLIKIAQNLGFSLKEIQNSLPKNKNNELSNDDWKNIGKAWKKLLLERVLKMQKLSDQLGECIGCGCLAMKTCPLRNPNDKLAQKGPGAHLL